MDKDKLKRLLAGLSIAGLMAALSANKCEVTSHFQQEALQLP
jgi:radical SAM modification target selenobiotic family peptide